MKTNSINWTPISSHKELEAGRSEPERNYMGGYIFDETPDMPNGQKAVEFVKITDSNHYSAVAVMGSDWPVDDATNLLGTIRYEVAVTVVNSPYGDVTLWSRPIEEEEKAFKVADQLAEAIDKDDFARVLLYTSLYQFESNAEVLNPEDNALRSF